MATARTACLGDRVSRTGGHLAARIPQIVEMSSAPQSEAPKFFTDRQLSDCRLCLGNLLENAPFRFDPDRNQRKRRDQKAHRERVERVLAESVSDHDADHGGHQERSDAPYAEEPADRGCTDVRRVKLANIDARRAVD